VPWITAEDKKAISKSLESRWLTGGPIVADFERLAAAYLSSKHATAVNSCTAALHLAMRVLDIKTGDEVIVPDLTFAATANAPIFCGAKPVFADIDEKTFNILPSEILRKITPRTKAVIPVHYGGQACDMREILEIAEDYRLHVIEDCAHSLGSHYEGIKTGNLGTIGCFSFYPTKIITTFEGGMATTNDEKLDRRLRLLREHGMSKTAIDREKETIWRYDVVDLGYNYRLSEPQGALGITQLKRIDAGIKKRKVLANYYTRMLCKLFPSGIVPPYEAPNRSHIFHLYTIKVQKDVLGISRNTLFNRLLEKGVQTSVHYTPLHLMSFYKQFMDGKACDFVGSEHVYEEILTLPLYPSLSQKDIATITERIEKVVEAS
jgi:perosamine synthetase